MFSALTPSHFTTALYFPFFPLPLVFPPPGTMWYLRLPSALLHVLLLFPWASYLSFSSHPLSTPQIPQPPPATFPFHAAELCSWLSPCESLLHRHEQVWPPFHDDTMSQRWVTLSNSDLMSQLSVLHLAMQEAAATSPQGTRYLTN